MVTVTAAASGVWTLAAATSSYPPPFAHTLIQRNRLGHREHGWKQLDIPAK